MGKTKNLAFLLETFSQAKFPYSRTRIQKMTFLGIKEEKLPYTFEFSSHYYGPYSKELAETVASLAASGVLEEKSMEYSFKEEYFPVVEYDYSLTPFGYELQKIHSAELTEIEKEKIRKLCRKYDKKSLTELVSYVHQQFPL